MDAERFETLLRGFSIGSRRGLVPALPAATLATRGAFLGYAESDAKKEQVAKR